MKKTWLAFCTIFLLLSILTGAQAKRYQLNYSVIISGFKMVPNHQFNLKEGMNITGYFQSEAEFVNGTQIIGVFNSSSILEFPVGKEVNQTFFPDLFIFSGYTGFLDNKTFVPVRVIFNLVWIVNDSVVNYPGFNFTLPSDFLDENAQCLGESDYIGTCKRDFSFQYWNVTAEFSTNFAELPATSSGNWSPLLLLLGIPVILIFLLYKLLNR